jgi:hypothetical protein
MDLLPRILAWEVDSQKHTTIRTSEVYMRETVREDEEPNKTRARVVDNTFHFTTRSFLVNYLSRGQFL